MGRRPPGLGGWQQGANRLAALPESGWQRYVRRLAAQHQWLAGARRLRFHWLAALVWT